MVSMTSRGFIHLVAHVGFFGVDKPFRIFGGFCDDGNAFYVLLTKWKAVAKMNAMSCHVSPTIPTTN